MLQTVLLLLTVHKVYPRYTYVVAEEQHLVQINSVSFIAERGLESGSSQSDFKAITILLHRFSFLLCSVMAAMQTMLPKN